MKRLLLVFLGLVTPLLAQAQSAGLVAQADQKKIHGDFRGALADYSQALAQDPKNVGAWLGRGSLHSLQGDYSGAIADDTKAISLDPKNAVAFSNRGNARTFKGDLAGALTDYTRAIALDPNHVLAFLNRGNIRNLQKQYAAAIADYTQALTLDPKNAAAWYNRAGARRALANYTGAAADYSQALTLNPVDVPAYLNRAVLRIAQRDWVGATADLQKTLDLVPEERQAYPRIYLWVVETEETQSKQARDELMQYLEETPKTFAATWGFEIARFLAGQETEQVFLASAQSVAAKKDRGQVAQSFYYAGLKRSLAGHGKGATKFLHQCQAAGNPALHEFILAREELKALGAPAK